MLRLRKELRDTVFTALFRLVDSNKAAAMPEEDIILRDAHGRSLPDLSTPAQIAEALQVTSRTVLQWEADKKISAALRSGRIVRFHPATVARELGIHRG